MVELVSLACVPISSSMDHLYAGSPAPLGLTTGTGTDLRRAKSMNRLHTVTGSQETAPLAESAGGYPIHANSRRKRSQSDVIYEADLSPPDFCSIESDSRISQEIPCHRAARSCTPYSKNQRQVPAEFSSSEYGPVSHREASRSRIRDRATSSQRTPSRGRARKRDTPRPTSTTARNVGRSNISKRRKPINVQASSKQQVDESSCNDDDATSHSTKGIFWLPQFRGPEELRFPESRSQPESSWALGDGFSGDEAQPEFMFLMTGRRKRKRSRSLSALGQLTLEPANASIGDEVGSALGRSSNKRRQVLQVKDRRSEVRDLWPTRENFAEGLVSKRTEDKTPEKHTTIQPTPPGTASTSGNIRPAVPRKRQPSAFWNFGRSKQRSQSRAGVDFTSSSAMNRLLHEESMGLTDDTEEESEEQVTTDGDSDSEWLAQEESDDQDNADVDMQDTITYRRLDDELLDATNHRSEGGMDTDHEDFESPPLPFLDRQGEDDDYVIDAS